MIKLPTRSFYRQTLYKWPLALGIACFGLLLSLVLEAPTPAFAAVCQGTTVAGTVYRDYNANGIQDGGEPGIAGITVTAYGSDGTATSCETTADGTYGIDPAVAAPWRLEYTLPTDGSLDALYPGVAGPGSATSVTFVNGPATDINVGFNNPADYCGTTASPDLAISCFTFGEQNSNSDGVNQDAAVLYQFPYTAGSTDLTDGAAVRSPAPSPLAVAKEMGAVWGLAWSPLHETLYTAAFMKRHVGFGPYGPGAIYQLNNGTVSLFHDFGNIAGTDPHPQPGETCTAPGHNALTNNFNCWLHDVDSFDQVGKVGFGDLDISEDFQTLYTVNLATNELMLIPIDNPAAYTAVAVPNPASCPAADLRAFGLGVQDGVVYVGLVCSAESTQDRNQLRAYVYRFVNGAFDTTPVLDFPLTYARGGSNAIWQYWLNRISFNSGDPIQSDGKWAQPWLTDIAFDNGDMILALRDRNADLFGSVAGGPDPADSTNYSAKARGDILRACQTGNGWLLEENGACGNVTTAGANTGQGPGNGEYYFMDQQTIPMHNETSLGSQVQVPGLPDVVSVIFNPIEGNINEVSDGGIKWYNNATGTTTRSYLIFDASGNPARFEKANGLGDLEVLCPLAPLEIGNRVWEDSNGNGVQDPNEPPIAGVTVELYKSNTLVATAVTNGAGEYYFVGDTAADPDPADHIGVVVGKIQPNQSDYEVRIVLAQPALIGLVPTLTTNDASPNGVLRDSNGISNGNTVVAAVASTGPGQNNHTYDFGFTTSLQPPPPSISLKKYTNGEDADTLTGPEVAYGGTVTWTYDIVNTGGVTLTNITLVDDMEGGITCPQASLIPGAAMTCTLTGIASTLGQYTNTAIVTGTPTLYPTERVTDTDPSHYLTRPFSLGNRVWLDNGSGGGITNDGVQNGGEVGIGGVVVNLLDGNGAPVLDANNQPISTVTSANGCYLFDNLRQGDYIVEIAAENFAPGQPLTNLISSTGNSTNNAAPAPNNDVDLDDNGNDIPVNQAIRSGIVTLSLNGEPLDEAPCDVGSGNALDINSNLTVDFGFIPVLPVSVGDYVWFDDNSNGLQDGTEAGVPGVTVRIFTSTGQPATDINGQPVPPQVTSNTGSYLFTDLPPGSYYVVFDLTTLPTGYVVTPPNAGSDDELDSDASPSTGQTSSTAFLPGGSTDLSLDMGIVQLTDTVRVGDYVWYDNNFNGSQDPGEPGVPNIGVTLFDAATDQPVTTSQTDSSGFYLFDNLPPGQYYVVFNLDDLPANYRVTTQNAGGVADTADSDANPVTGRSDNSRSLAAGEEDLTLDMGIFPLLSLGNLVWEDRNNNGLVDPGEQGLPDIPVRLYDLNNTLLMTTTTDANGNYRFNGLLPGDYIVEITVPPGYSSSTGGEPGDEIAPYEPAPDPDNDIDNDDNGTATGNPRIIRSSAVTLSVGDEPTSATNADPNYNPTVDFGVCVNCGSSGVLLSALGNFVWRDESCDGVQELNAIGVPGVTVRLFNENGDLIDTVQTNANGLYRFDGLPNGTYYIEFERPLPPPVYTFAPVNQGGNSETDSDAVPVNGDNTLARTSFIQLVDDQTDLSWDAGLCVPTNETPSEEPIVTQSSIFLPMVIR